MPFKEMDPEIAMKLIEGYQNELLPEQKAQDAFYRQQVCPRCGGNVEKHFLSIRHAFGGDGLAPRSGMKCVRCECVFDPHTNLVVSVGIDATPGSASGSPDRE